MTEFPVLEVAILDVRPGQADAFRESFAQARRIIEAAQGFGGLELRACIESPDRFLLLAWWDSVESHEVGFRGSDAYQEWKRLLHHFYDPFPTVEHYVRGPVTVEYRSAGPGDAEAIARLHADSWRRAYRGMYSDEFLDGDLVGERLAVWEPRLSEPSANQFVLMALDGERLAGFVCGYGASDEQWGSLVDNLHVSYDVRRRGIARTLMRSVGEWFASSYGDLGVWLWVIEANTDARAFYERIGGSNAETIEMPFLSGNVGRSCRYVWPSPAALVAGTQ